MKYYAREILERDYVGKYRRAVYVKYTEFFKTNDERMVSLANKRKRISFVETDNEDLIYALRKLTVNRIYKEETSEIGKRGSGGERWTADENCFIKIQQEVRNV